MTGDLPSLDEINSAIESQRKAREEVLEAVRFRDSVVKKLLAAAEIAANTALPQTRMVSSFARELLEKALTSEV